MLSFAPAHAAIVRCFSTPDALDRVGGIPDAFACRVAPDELMLIGPGAAQDEILSQAEQQVRAVDADALVVAQPDGWTIWSLRGDDRTRAFARLAPNPLPEAPAFMQGAVAHVPAKVIVLPDAIHVMVPSTLGHHLRARIGKACVDLDPTEGSRASFAVQATRADALS